jgi:phage tail-like protein
VRGLIPGLRSPHPLGEQLPAPYLDDDLAQRMMEALDEVLAPVFCTLDNLEAYFDPELAPEDFVHWLAAWVGMDLDETWSDERRRRSVAQAVELFTWRGTTRGIRELVSIYAGVEPEIVESGGAVYSEVPGGELPGTPDAHLTVRIRVDDPATVDVARLDRLIAASKPAHLPHEVEVIKA